MKLIMKKKGIMGPIISVFVMVLVIAILAGLTFLFIVQLKTNVATSGDSSTTTTVNETGWLNLTSYKFVNSNAVGFRGLSIVVASNATGQQTIGAGNYTLGTDYIIGNGRQNWTSPAANFTYSYTFATNPNAYNSVNTTETAGSTIVSYLALIFLAIIFGAILTLVLKLILPYINLGKSMGGF